MRSRLSRPLARRFVAGETAEQAFDAVAQLNSQGALVTLDYLGENVTSAAEAAAVRQTYIGLLDEIGQRGLKCNVSLKLTALGLDVSRSTCEANLRAILDAAQRHDNFVRIDMEGSDYTQVTLDIFEQMFVAEGRKNVGVVIQSYLYRSAADIERTIDLQARVRLCKGAYNEPPSVAYPQKADVDKNYIALARRLVCDGNYPGLATHDSAIIDWIKAFAREQQIDHGRYEFQMLYGVRRDLQQQLIKDGYKVRVYVPFGEAWYPYLMRRLAERPANLLFILRALRHS
ncbi:MAG TPA: proline dehydrogenase family protein [Herpetosiphonaceae bacterium]